MPNEKGLPALKINSQSPVQTPTSDASEEYTTISAMR